MKEKNRLLILKILTAAALFLAVYSLILALRVSLFGDSGGVAVFLFYFLFSAAGTAAGITGSYGGWFSGKISGSRLAGILLLYSNPKEKERVISTILLYLSGIVPVLITLALFLQGNVLRAGFEGACILVVYLLAIKCGVNGAYDNMTTRAAVTGLVIFLLAFGASIYYAPLMFLKSYISIFAYIFLLVFLIVKNQEDIDYNIFSGKYVEKSVLPKEMRIYNLKAVILLFTIILALLNFKIVAMLLAQIGDWLLAGLRALFALLGNDSPAEQLAPAPAQAPAANFPFLGGGAEAPEHPLSAYIRGVLVTTLLLYIAFKLLLAIYRYVFKKLLPMLIDLIKRFLKPGEKEQFVSDGDYDDEIEIEKPVSDRAARREARARVKKARRDLKSIIDPVERVRCMYAIVLGLLQSGGVGVMNSDTVGEVYAKAAGITGIRESLQILSGKYEKVRYGSRVPESGELSETEKSYNDIMEHLLKKR